MSALLPYDGICRWTLTLGTDSTSLRLRSGPVESVAPRDEGMRHCVMMDWPLNGGFWWQSQLLESVSRKVMDPSFC